jgi:hypothetical protein
MIDHNYTTNFDQAFLYEFNFFSFLFSLIIYVVLGIINGLLLRLFGSVKNFLFIAAWYKVVKK